MYTVTREPIARGVKRDIDRKFTEENRRRLSSVHRDKGRIKRSMRSDKTFFSAFCALYHFNVHTYIHTRVTSFPLLHICTYVSASGTRVYIYFEQRPDNPGVNSKKHTLCSSPYPWWWLTCSWNILPLATYFTHTHTYTDTHRRGFIQNIACRYLNRVFHRSVSNFLGKFYESLLQQQESCETIYARLYDLARLYTHIRFRLVRKSRRERD